MILATLVSVAAVCFALVFLAGLTTEMWVDTASEDNVYAAAGLIAIVGIASAVSAVVNAAFRFLA